MAEKDYTRAAAAYDAAFANYAQIPEKTRPWRMMWYQTGPYFAYYYTGRYQDVINLATQTLDAMSEPILEESFYWRARASFSSGGCRCRRQGPETVPGCPSRLRSLRAGAAQNGHRAAAHAGYPTIEAAMPKILHFADAHIDMANYGRHDPQTGLPMRVMDFLKSLDKIVDTAIAEQVDLVLFAGDAYKDRQPPPTFQREWGRRMMRLSRAGIPTLLLVGNHDLSPALGRAHALESFDTLEVPHVHVLDRPCFLRPDELEGLPLQVIALPWIFRSGLMAVLDEETGETAQVYEKLGERLVELVQLWLEASGTRFAGRPDGALLGPGSSLRRRAHGDVGQRPGPVAGSW